MYCVVELNNKQYKIEQGKPVLVDQLDAEQDGEVEIDRVLLFSDDKGEVKVGTPYLKNFSLKAKVLGSAKGKKVKTFTYKKRKDYRRTVGMRPRYTRLLVEKIQGA
jgi:large subunit ribosomal protein L21